MPAEVDEVILCRMMGLRLSCWFAETSCRLAIGKRGQNVRLASKLRGWDIEIMTEDELEKQIEKAVAGFSAIKGVTEDLANRLVGEGYLSYDDLSVIEPTDLQEMGSLSEEEVEHIVEQAEVLAEQAERLAKENPQAQPEKKLFSGRFDQPAAPEASGRESAGGEEATGAMRRLEVSGLAVEGGWFPLQRNWLATALVEEIWKVFFRCSPVTIIQGQVRERLHVRTLVRNDWANGLDQQRRPQPVNLRGR
jgi:hypothetical protein